jgi:integrase
MATFAKRKNGDGTTSVRAWVRVRPFKPTAKTFPNREAARSWAATLEAELRQKRKAGEVRKDLPTLTLKQLIEDYLEDPETKALNTFDDVERLLGWWTNKYASEKVLEFGTLKLREARTLLNTGRKAGTVNRYLGALRSCWSWGRAAGYIGADKVWPTRLFLTEPRERVRFLNDDELKAVLGEAEKHSPWMHAAVVVSLATGLRQGELLRLEWKDINTDKKTVTVHISKNTKRRTVHLPEPAVTALKKLRRDGVVGPKRVFTRPDGTPADKSYLTVAWNKVRTGAQLVDFKWHDLRHSCASFLAQNGASLVEIGSVLGHSSPSITAKYSHLVQGRPVTGSAALAAKLEGKLQ